MTRRSAKVMSTVVTVAVGLMVAVMTTGCATITEHEGAGDPEALEEEARNFHSNMRWARYEHAADSVHEAYRHEFEGEYEERGDDYEIVDMEMKTAEMLDDGFVAEVEVEQQWYELPSTVVETERFVERWVFEDERWQLRERLLRDEYRDRDETFDSERDADDERADESGGEQTAAP